MPVIPIGRLGRPRGLNGEMFVIAYHEASPAWSRGTRLEVVASACVGAKGGARPAEDLTVARIARGSKGRLVVAFEEVPDLEAAQALVGLELGLDAAAFEPLEEDEFYHHEMPGWSIVTTTGEFVGTVIGVVSLQQDLLEVRPPGGGETFFVPMVKDVVRALDRAERRVVIEPLEGLLP